MTNPQDLEETAERAVRARALQASAYFVEPDGALSMSSGVLLQRGSVLCVLTAAHCVEDFPRHAAGVLVGFVGIEEPLPLVRDWVRHSQHDIALIKLSTELPSGVAGGAISTDMLGPDRPASADDDSALLVGNPSAAVCQNPSRAELGVLTYHQLVCWSEIGVCQDGRLTMPWRDAVVGGLDRPAPPWLERQHAARSGTVPLPSPKGMSGGGLWHVRRQALPPKEDLWKPESHLRLVAIQSAFVGGMLRLEPVDRVRAWIEESLAGME